MIFWFESMPIAETKTKKIDSKKIKMFKNEKTTKWMQHQRKKKSSRHFLFFILFLSLNFFLPLLWASTRIKRSFNWLLRKSSRRIFLLSISVKTESWFSSNFFFCVNNAFSWHCVNSDISADFFVENNEISDSRDWEKTDF